MTGDGFTEDGLAQLRRTLADHVEQGHAPGAVVALAHRGRVHVEAVGTTAVGGALPMAADTPFRITSMTRPITAVAALQLVDDGVLALDEPIDAHLPELADRPVLRRLDGPVDEVVPAERAVTVEDLLTFRSGFGMLLAPPDQHPVLQAERALELASAGPPVPRSPHGIDEWLRRMGTLPLMDQPGTTWRYVTSSMVLGALVARASGQSLPDRLRERIFEPLGMHDTSFTLRPDQVERAAAPYDVDPEGNLVPADDEGQWQRPPAFPDGGGGLVSTAADYLAFGELLRGGGVHGRERLLSAGAVAAMTTDQLTPEQRAGADLILQPRGWGYGLSILDDPTATPRGFGWDGGFGTTWATDPAAGLTGVVLTQVLFSPFGSTLLADAWASAYAALAP